MQQSLSNSEFDKLARKYNFKFLKKTSDEIIYNRKISLKNEDYIEVLSQLITDKKRNDFTIALKTLRVDLIKYYEPSLIKRKYKESECIVATKENEVDFCYTNKIYTMRLIDRKVENENHFVLIFFK